MPNDTGGYVPPSHETTTKEAGQRVASTAQEQAGKVAGEAKHQAGNLIGEAGTQIKDQAEGQKAKTAEGLRSLGKELQSMADGGDQSGLAADLARQASQKSQDVADWLDGRDTGGLVEEVREFARRKPGTFLVGCVVAGVVAGRLTRGAVDAQRSDSDAEDGYVPAGPAYADTGGYEFATGGTLADPLTDPLRTVPEAGQTGSTYGTGEGLR